MGPLLIKSMGGIQSKFTWKVIPDLFQTELLIFTQVEIQQLKRHDGLKHHFTKLKKVKQIFFVAWLTIASFMAVPNILNSFLKPFDNPSVNNVII